MRTHIPIPHSRAAAAAKRCLVVCALLLAPAITGCEELKEPDRGANQSLVEIGERSLELAEELEGEGRRAEANVQYKRSLWAFKYHERLTGEEPFLLDDALDGIARTGPR